MLSTQDLACLTRLCFTISGYVLYYNWKIPEEERHDSALKRHKEALTAEVKLWEGCLQKVNLMIMKHCTLETRDKLNKKTQATELEKKAFAFVTHDLSLFN